MVAIVVPAYNEEARIATVLEACLDATLASEIIVVSDGSTDRTVEVARTFPGVRVIDLPANKGKGGAMACGVWASRADVICFVDADLVGIHGGHLDEIIKPVVDRRCDMCIGVFRGGKFWSDTAQRISPYISGQRAVRREILEGIPFLSDLRMGVEVTINTYAKRRGARVLRVPLRGVSNSFKEQKMGVLKGTAARARMYMEIGQAMVKVRKKRSRGGRFFRV